MFIVTRVNDARLDLEISGKLDSEAMKLLLDELIAKSEGISAGRMLYRIAAFNIPTIGAMAVEMSRLPELFTLMQQFSRIAVLTDTDWVKKVSEFEGAVIPNVDIKGFSLEDLAAAEAWLEQ
ncbi:STAS/SEC14 domain-containing protein [Motilimonas cestriensis]|uniref:STAS/SEC14 domain-containing protein n=1 Tax=Motilimonas cestriensis TaxID=2742685 RepID=A0ABS8WF96_9GAMM|nr:STAS/SEC14 domain-containing protein [Motilimonas cestriensis]MCE2596940.1 STAS/SEC14 domain-containing protein [Motilimonas cestriensis]